MSLSILIPKTCVILGWAAAGTTALIAGIQFTNTVTVGSIIVAGVVVLAGGALQIRNNMRSYWRGLAEERAEKIASLETDVKERDAKLHEIQDQTRADMVKFAEEQRAIRHDLKNQNAALLSTLQVETAKTDLTALMEQMASQHSEALTLITDGLGKQDEIIRILAGNWNNDGPPQTEGDAPP